MFFTDESNLPKVLVHRSHFGQLAIGGAMMDQRNIDYQSAYDATCPSGGWKTRFDDEQCPTVVSMYIEGLMHIHGWNGEDCDSMETVTRPVAYAQVLVRGMTRDGMIEKSLYLKSSFYFSEVVTEDGIHDLAEAYAMLGFRGMSSRERDQRRQGLTLEESNSLRSWKHVRKGSVPGHVRRTLHKTSRTTARIVDDNFGQGKDFFTKK